MPLRVAPWCMRAPPKPVERLRTISPSEFFGLYSIKSGTKDILFAATDMGLLKSGDAGERWTTAELPEALTVTGLFVAPNSDGRLFARATNTLVRMTLAIIGRNTTFRCPRQI